MIGRLFYGVCLELEKVYFVFRFTEFTMSEEVASVPATPAAPTPKKKAKNAGAKKTKTAPSHPKVSEMVLAAITDLKERGGSSLQAIKKYVGSHYKVDLERLTPFLKKYLKSAVASGALVQTKGKGATGSFKLSATGQKSKEPGKKKPAAKKEAAAKKAKPSSPKKVAKPKPKAAGAKKKVAKKSPVKKAASKAKSPKKTTKPKAPKAKKLKATPKKAASKKASKK